MLMTMSNQTLPEAAQGMAVAGVSLGGMENPLGQ